MNTNDFNFDDVEDLPEIVEEPNGTYTGMLTVTEAKPKKGSLGRSLRIKFATEDGRVILARVGLLNNDGSQSYDAPVFKKQIKPFLEKAGLGGSIANVLSLFSDFPCVATFKTEPWVDSDGNERTSVRMTALNEKA